MLTYNEFTETYDPKKDFSFSNIVFRRGKYPPTLPFGILVKSWGDWRRWDLGDFKDKRPVYIHLGVDRSRGSLYQPLLGKLEFQRPAVGGYGSLLFSRPDGYDFEFRIAHMEHPAEQIKKAIQYGNSVEKGEWIGHTGNVGLSSQGEHCHFEIVSNSPEGSVILNEIIENHPKKEWLHKDVLSQALVTGTQEEVDYINKYKSANLLEKVTPGYIIRRDPVTGGQVWFYNSEIILNI